MSVDGLVFCRCREDGLAIPPPCPVVSNGPYLSPAAGFEDRREDVDAWVKLACPHADFALAEIQVRRAALREAIGSHGGDASFPALTAALPKGNDGSVEVDDVVRCLAELDQLNGLMRDEGTMTVLTDVDSAEVLHVWEPGWGWISMSPFVSDGLSISGFDSRYRIQTTGELEPDATATWLTAEGLVQVRLAASGKVLFSSAEFTQEVIGATCVFRDPATGVSVQHTSPVNPTSVRLRAEIRPIDIDVYLTGVADLRSLFEASVATGHPVIWY